MLQHVGSQAMRTLLLHLLFTSSTVKAEYTLRMTALQHAHAFQSLSPQKQHI